MNAPVGQNRGMHSYCWAYLRREAEQIAPTVSNDTRVRMEGFVKIMAMVRPAKGL